MSILHTLFSSLTHFTDDDPKPREFKTSSACCPSTLNFQIPILNVYLDSIRELISWHDGFFFMGVGFGHRNTCISIFC